MPSGGVSVAESLAPVFTVRLADQTTAGSQIPESHEEPRRRSAGGSQLAVGAEFPSTSPALQPVSYSGKRSITSAMVVLVGRDR